MLLHDCKESLVSNKWSKTHKQCLQQEATSVDEGSLQSSDSRSVRRWESGEELGCSLKPSLQTQIFAVAQGRGAQRRVQAEVGMNRDHCSLRYISF